MKARRFRLVQAPIDVDELPVSPTLKVVRRNDPWHGYSDEDREDCEEFIRCYLREEMAPLLSLPCKAQWHGIWWESHEEFLESAFNTWDYERYRGPVDRAAYWRKKVVEEVEKLAVLHSSISEPEGRRRVEARYEALIEAELRGPACELVARYAQCQDPKQRAKLKQRIGRYQGLVLQCREVWRTKSPPD